MHRGPFPVPRHWHDVMADGRLAKLIAASAVCPWVRGLGSWIPECQPHEQRYTICVEETPYTDFTSLAKEYALFMKQIGESDWMCFELKQRQVDEPGWQGSAYPITSELRHAFHTGIFGVSLPFDACPLDPKRNLAMEFWITVTR